MLAPWQTPSARKSFFNMTQCLIGEYNNFCYPSSLQLCVNGINTQGENIADNAGIQAAYYAYQGVMQNKAPEPAIPGFEKFTNNQMFFLSFATLWCENPTPSSLTNQLLTDVHSPARDRINGVLRNVDIFGLAFNCPRGSPMFPKENKQCQVYRPYPITPPTAPPVVPTPKPTASQSPGFKAAAQLLLNAMTKNKTVSPCQDFFTYACQGWQQANPIPPWAGSIDTTGQLQNQDNTKMLKAIQNINPTAAITPKTLITANILYQSCLNGKDSQYSKAHQVIALLQGKNPGFNTNGWPLITPNWTVTPTGYDMWKQVAYLQAYFGVTTLLSSSIDVDWGNVSRSALFIDQGSTTYSPQYYVGPGAAANKVSYVNMVYGLAQQLAKDANLNFNSNQAMADANAMWNLEKQLSQSFVPSSKRRIYKTQYNPMVFTKLNSTWPIVNWNTYITQMVLNKTTPAHLGNRLIMSTPTYFNGLTRILRPGGGITTRTLINFMGFQFILNYQDFLGGAYNDISIKFKNSFDSHITGRSVSYDIVNVFNG